MYVQDLGRFGNSIYGVGVSGAADRLAFFQAHRLLGTPASFPVLEILLGQVEFYCSTDMFFTVTGAPLVVKINGVKYFSHQRLFASAGSEVVLTMPQSGLRSYCAFRGRLEVDQVLGSCSWDSLNNLGPPPLHTGDRIPIREIPQDFPPVNNLMQYATPIPKTDTELMLHLSLAADRYESILAHDWVVQTLSNRTAVRLRTTNIFPEPSAVELSQPVFRGSVQLTPPGELVIFLSDHPTSGGYLSMGAVDSLSCDISAQLRPGDKIKFISGSPEEVLRM